MLSYTDRDAAKNFGALIESDDDEAVVVRLYGCARAAVVGWRLFKAYKRAYDEKVAAHLVVSLEAKLKALDAGGPTTTGEARALKGELEVLIDAARRQPPADE